MTKEEADKLPLGLYILYWDDESGGGSSLAAVGYGVDGARWFSPTNWTVVPSREWGRVARVELLMTKPSQPRPDAIVSIQNEAHKQLSLYPAVDYTPLWHPYYWQGQRDAARKIELEAK